MALTPDAAVARWPTVPWTVDHRGRLSKRGRRLRDGRVGPQYTPCLRLLHLFLGHSPMPFPPHPHPRLATSCPKHRLVFGWESALPFPLPAGLLVGTDALSEAKKRPNIVPSPSAFLVFLLHLLPGRVWFSTGSSTGRKNLSVHHW